jgi:23S rRNA (cytosine1962-C5)-methyltransferase
MQIFEAALTQRMSLLSEPHDSAVRLFNGFTEGLPGLVVEVYARTLVLLNHSAFPAELEWAVAQALEFYRWRLPWLESGLLKTRRDADPEERLGRLLFGERLAKRVRENGLVYALDLRLNQDTSFYIDTRLLRDWLRHNANGRRVFNTFAYTGSLGAACVAGGAEEVLQSDLNRRFLNLGKDTYALNGWPVRRADFLAEDFFRIAARLRRTAEFFDLVVLDPPFFSETPAGRVDLVGEMGALVNKVRPLVRDGGRLVVVNNALYVSGLDLLSELERVGTGGWLDPPEILPAPEDAAGYEQTRSGFLPADPAPFNHATKIAVMTVRRKRTVGGDQSVV